MPALLASFFSTVFAFLWKVLSSFWPRRRTDGTSSDFDLEAGCDPVPVIVEVAEGMPLPSLVVGRAC